MKNERDIPPLTFPEAFELHPLQKMEEPRSPPLHIHGKSKIPITLIIFFFLLFHPSMAEIPIGSVLYASGSNQTWFSPSRNFSLHFIQLTSSSYSFALTYADTIPVWVAGGGGDSSAAVDAAGSFHFLPSGDLQLRNGSGAVLWRAGTAGLGVSGAALEGSGNFVLKNTSGPVWTSFEHPSDTILPSQNFTAAMALRSGSYSFVLKSNGNLTLLWNNTVNYWNLGFNSSANASFKNPNLSIQSTGILNLDDPELPSSTAIAYSSDFGDSAVAFRFLKLDDDGNLRIYSSKGTTDPATSAVDVTWTAVTDQCEVFGYCGNFGVCSYNDTGPICSCPSKNFDPVDPNDSRKGCRRKEALEDCSSPTMVTMERTKLLDYSSGVSIGIDSCRSNCLGNLSCLASTALGDGSGLCDQKIEGFVSVYQSAALPSTTFVKVCGPVAPDAPLSSHTTRHSRNLRPWIIVAVVLGTLFALALVETLIWWWCCRKMQRFNGGSAQYALLEYASGAPVQFPYRELHRATKGFKERLGSGGFGAVYKGTLVNRTPVAVKQLEGIEQGEKEFRMEVATISSTHHLNLVRLIGFCSESRHRLLVYEFMSHGSLDHFLFGEPTKFLSWERRFSIALGTARGITYLHEECRDCIVHCDIKPENILLDESFNAKVSDFGLARLVGVKERRSSVRGTRGYLAPEWLGNLPVSSRSDVYSFGMVLLEVVSGRRNFEVSRETGGRRFWVWAYEEFERGSVEGIVDGRVLGEMGGDLVEVVRVVKVGFWCIQEQPAQRPTMGKVVQMLEGVVEVEMPPPPNVAHEGLVVGGGSGGSVAAARVAMSVEKDASVVV